MCECAYSLCGTGASRGAWSGCGGPTGLSARTSSVLPERWMANSTSTSVSPGNKTHTLSTLYGHTVRCSVELVFNGGQLQGGKIK